MQSSVPLVCALLPLVLGGCNTPADVAWKGLALDPVTSQIPAGGESVEVSLAEVAEAPQAEAEQAEPEQPDPEELAHEIEKKLRESYQADLELAIAEQKAHSAEAKAAGNVEETLAAHQAASEAVEQYAKVETRQLLAAAQLKIDELTFRLEMAKQELEQMEAEYNKFQADSHAGQTGKIVIWRETKKVDHATRRLIQQHGLRKTLDEYTIPRRGRELELALAKAQRALDRAREDLVRTEVESKLSLRKAQDKQGLLKFELARLRAKQKDS